MNEIHGKDEDFKAIFKARNPVVLVKFLFENLNFRKRTMFEKKSRGFKIKIPGPRQTIANVHFFLISLFFDPGSIEFALEQRLA